MMCMFLYVHMFNMQVVRACACVYVCVYVVVAYVCMCSFIYHHLCSHVFFRMHHVCLYMIECAGMYILFVCACVVSVCVL
jgi:hypothetical protein